MDNDTDWLVRCKELKERGNRRLATGNSAGALQFYAEALQHLDTSNGDTKGADATQLAAILHSNSAQALMKQRKWLEAIDQCHAALRFDPAHTKSSWRGAMCAIEVGMHDVAVAFVESGLDENMVSTELLELRRRLGPLPDVELHKDDGDESSMDPSQWHLPSEQDKVAKRHTAQKPLPPDKEKG
ncbi:unnamed protein product [Durusdinium trenchii]